MCNNLYNNLSKSSAAKLLLYIPYFERARGADASSWASREETEGALTFSKFIDDFHQTNLMDYEYLDTINTVVADMKEVDKYIVDADLELLKAILTGYIRQERFNEGLWERVVEENIFLSILYRLKELL